MFLLIKIKRIKGIVGSSRFKWEILFGCRVVVFLTHFCPVYSLERWQTASQNANSKSACCHKSLHFSYMHIFQFPGKRCSSSIYTFIGQKSNSFRSSFSINNVNVFWGSERLNARIICNGSHTVLFVYCNSLGWKSFIDGDPLNWTE